MTHTIRSLYLTALLSLMIVSGYSQPTPEIKEALDYLNKVRKKPVAYSKEIGTDLSTVEPRGALTWNDTLGKVAQAKAEDMMKRDFSGHVDPDGNGIDILMAFAGYNIPFPKLPDNNLNESLAMGQTTLILSLIALMYEYNEPDHQRAGHRMHLLGIGPDCKYRVDIGIGWATNPKSRWRTYTCVIISKHLENN